MLNSIGKHTQLIKLDKGQETIFFTANTSSDVYVTEDGLTLEQYLPLSVDSLTAPTEYNAMVCLQMNSIDITDNDLINALVNV